MTEPSPRYDEDAADVVTRTLLAVAATTPRRSGIGLAPGPIAVPPVPTRPAWLKWVGGAVAAAVVAAGLAWAERDGPPVGGQSVAFIGAADAPPELVPGRLPESVVPAREPAAEVGVSGVTVDAVVLGPGEQAGDVVGAVVATTDGRPLPETLPDYVAAVLADTVGAAVADASVVAPAESSRAYLAVPRGAVGPGAVDTVLDVLDDGAFADPGADPRLATWRREQVPVDWLPALAPTTRRGYEGDGGTDVELMAVAADLPGVAAIAGLLEGAEPFVVGGATGWRAPSARAAGPCPCGRWRRAGWARSSTTACPPTRSAPSPSPCCRRRPPPSPHPGRSCGWRESRPPAPSPAGWSSGRAGSPGWRRRPATRCGWRARSSGPGAA